MWKLYCTVLIDISVSMKGGKNPMLALVKQPTSYKNRRMLGDVEWTTHISRHACFLSLPFGMSIQSPHYTHTTQKEVFVCAWWWNDDPAHEQWATFMFWCVYMYFIIQFLVIKYIFIVLKTADHICGEDYICVCNICVRDDEEYWDIAQLSQYAFVFVFVFVYICVYACMHTYCVCISMYVCSLHTCIHACMHAHAYAYAYTHTHIFT